MDNLFSVISKINNQMNQFIHTRLQEEGYDKLHVSHGSILINFIDKNKHNYKELSKKINKSPQTMTTLIRKLEQENYLKINKDVNDKRNKIVTITDKGKEFIPVMLKISEELYQIQYQNINSNEVSSMRDTLNKIISNFGESNES